jgi:hypothetical protein
MKTMETNETMEAKIRIVCSLNAVQLKKRRAEVLDKFAVSIAGFDELENGFRYRFETEESTLRDLIEIINLERKCCPFLDFKLHVEAGQKFSSVEVTGAKGGKEAIRSLFKWNQV